MTYQIWNLKIGRWLILSSLLFYLLSGCYILGGDEQGVVQLFGRVWASRVPSGLHYRPPWPMSKLHKLKVRKVQRINVGMGASDVLLDRGSAPSQAEFLTGDQNVINIRAVVQYTISDPVKFLFTVRDAEGVIRRSAESMLALSVAQIPVDLVLTTEKVSLQHRLRGQMQTLLDQKYGLGVSIVGMNIEQIAPPDKVKDAFEAVNDARQTRHRLTLDAQSYANTILPKARGESQKVLNDALAYKNKKVSEAIGESARFTAFFEAYRKAKDITAARVYIETMEEVLPRLRKVVIDGKDGEVDLGIIKQESQP